jgi:hypothetical protein
MRGFCIAIIVGLTVTTTASAQTADWRFHWQQGQALHYHVEHTTNVVEVAGGAQSGAVSRVEVKSKVEVIKRWEVLAVDIQGAATLQMSITAMRHEQTRPNGEVLVFDSRALDKSTPELREQLGKYVGQPLAVLRIDAKGRVVEVKQGVGNRYDVEPPFSMTLPPSAIRAGESWDRDYTIGLDPPLGTGQKYAAKQKHTCSKIEGSLATFAITTVLAKMPESKTEQLPLLQKMPEGEVVFDLTRGRLQSARLVIDRQIQGHQGEGSSYQFRSTYTEKIVE